MDLLGGVTRAETSVVERNGIQNLARRDTTLDLHVRRDVPATIAAAHLSREFCSNAPERCVFVDCRPLEGSAASWSTDRWYTQRHQLD